MLADATDQHPRDLSVVSAAAGAVGSIAGQIAEGGGAYVIGIASGPAKVAHLTNNLWFDAVIDDENEDVNARLRELAPQGRNVFFDNVGGPLVALRPTKQIQRGALGTAA